MRLQQQHQRRPDNAMLFPLFSWAVVQTLRDVKYDARTATLIVNVIQAYTVEIIVAEKIILKKEVAEQPKQIAVKVNFHCSMNFQFRAISWKE